MSAAGAGEAITSRPTAAGTSTAPVELRGVAPDALERYVISRLEAFSSQLCQALEGAGTNSRPVAAAAGALIAAAAAAASGPTRSLQPVDTSANDPSYVLLFTHDCASVGCADVACELCCHNPARRCTSNFAHKYLCGDRLRPKCDATIYVTLVEAATGARVANAPELTVEACLINGVEYELRKRAREDAEAAGAGTGSTAAASSSTGVGMGISPRRAGSARSAAAAMAAATGPVELSDLAMIQNKEGDPLLLVDEGGSTEISSKRVVFRLKDGVARLPVLRVTASSEALLSGRKPPFRLWVRPQAREQTGIKILQDLVSEPFVVATKRVRTAGKVDTPSVHDDISKIRHMGKETVKKLADLRTAAVAASLELPPTVPARVTKVAEFQELARLSTLDAQLALRMQQLLKMSKLKWQQACEHSMSAVLPDSRLRVWYSDVATMESGLLFACTMGCVELERPVGVLQRSAEIGADGRITMAVTLTSGQTPGQRQLAADLKNRAILSWWQPGHPGWAIYPQDTDNFLAAAQDQGQVTAQVTAPASAVDHQKLRHKQLLQLQEEQDPFAADPMQADPFAPGTLQMQQEPRLRPAPPSPNAVATVPGVRRLDSGGSSGSGPVGSARQPHHQQLKTQQPSLLSGQLQRPASAASDGQHQQQQMAALLGQTLLPNQSPVAAAVAATAAGLGRALTLPPQQQSQLAGMESLPRAATLPQLSQLPPMQAAALAQAALQPTQQQQNEMDADAAELPALPPGTLFRGSSDNFAAAMASIPMPLQLGPGDLPDFAFLGGPSASAAGVGSGPGSQLPLEWQLQGPRRSLSIGSAGFAELLHAEQGSGRLSPLLAQWGVMGGQLPACGSEDAVPGGPSRPSPMTSLPMLPDDAPAAAAQQLQAQELKAAAAGPDPAFAVGSLPAAVAANDTAQAMAAVLAQQQQQLLAQQHLQQGVHGLHAPLPGGAPPAPSAAAMDSLVADAQLQLQQQRPAYMQGKSSAQSLPEPKRPRLG